MQPRFVTIPYSRTFPVPVEKAFAWLTDYTDHDASLTTEVVKQRTVVQRGKDLVVLDGEIELLGTRGRGKVEVALFPPTRYVATIVEGRSKGSVYEYRLTPVAHGTRLDVEYRVRVKRVRSWLKVALARPLARRKLHAMWEGFAASMARDLK